MKHWKGGFDKTKKEQSPVFVIVFVVGLQKLLFIRMNVSLHDAAFPSKN
jgi:hypothetical protein